MTPSEELIAHLKQIAESRLTDAVDEALRLNVWTPGSPWHCKEGLIYCAELAASVSEYQLAGLAAYQAQRMHLSDTDAESQWGLPDLPGIEKATRQFNLVRYIPIQGRSIILRRPRVSDREFLMGMFLDIEFARLYSRPAIGNSEGRVYRTIKNDQRCPSSGDSWAWIICDTQDSPLGLLELSQVNFYQRSVDIALGFKSPNFGLIAVEAFALSTFIIFHHLNMDRVTGHVYGDNQHSHNLHELIASVREYTLEGLVSDPNTVHPVSTTVYTMMRDEARASRWLTRLRDYFSPSLPDLLSDQIGDISATIVTRGPRWSVFPPPLYPTLPNPPPEPLNSLPQMPRPPLNIEGKRLVLRALQPHDREILDIWFNTAGFIKSYPRKFNTGENIISISEQLEAEPGNMVLWLIEEKAEGKRIGIIGVELQNNLPVLFGISGFSSGVSLRNIVECWQLLRKLLFECYPHAKLYLKVPDGSPWLNFLERCDEFQRRGIERHQACAGYDGRINLAILEYTR